MFTTKRVEGKLHADPDEHMGYDIQFAANVTAPEAAPTAADAVAAAGKESTKSYLALVDAIRTGNKQKIMELCPPEKRAQIDTPDFPKMLQMVQMMTPTDIKVLKATETGDRATLVAKGMMDGKAQRGKIYLTRSNGKWVMSNETWGSE